MSLFKKYDVPAPRYTSYPTVPSWSESPTPDQWVGSMAKAMGPKSSTWSLYVHIPYCETLCTFCGCNTVITKNHQLEHPYVTRLLQELDLYLDQCPTLRERELSHLHLGGGTPTFLSETELVRLASGIRDRLKFSSDFEGSIEVDPRRTRESQLTALRPFGFDRVSLGVQDFDMEVQRLINRNQSEQETLRVVSEAKNAGYTSVNFDLIYGLPKQTLETIQTTVQKTLLIRPDRIALYSFALVPWIKPAQRLFKDEELPVGQEKRDLYEKARKLFLEAGYVEIGMDHFALPTENLSQALKSGKLHRNFMGYTDKKTDLLLALGVSGISETADCYHQNEKVLTVWERKIDQGQLATHRGHRLTEEDQVQKAMILDLMTKGQVSIQGHPRKDEFFESLQEMINDGLVNWNDQVISISETGKPFLRNACLALDLRWRGQNPEGQIFSRSI